MHAPPPLLVFSDDSKENDVYIDVFLWGEEPSISLCRSLIENLVESFRLAQASDFKAFHAYNVGAGKWSKYEAYYQNMFEWLAKMLKRNAIGCGVLVQSGAAMRSRVNIFKNTLQNELRDPASKFSRVLQGLRPEDYPVLSHRFRILLPFLILRGLAFPDHESVKYFPDSSGKWLEYESVERSLKTSDGISGEVPFFTINAIVARGYAKTLESLDLIKQGPDIIAFEPRSDESEPVLQLCDALSNFALCVARNSVGVRGGSTLEKAACMNRYFPRFESSVDLANVLVNDDGKIATDETEWFRIVNLRETL